MNVYYLPCHVKDIDTVNLEIFSEQNLVFKVIKESVKKTVQWQGVKNMTFFKGFPIKP